MSERVQALTRQLLQRVFLPLEASGRHVHLDRAAAERLFGGPLEPLRPLSQPGQFLSRQRLELLGPRGSLRHVAVLGPERRQCQVELSVSDCVALGIPAVFRHSGDLQGSPGITLRGPGGSLQLDTGAMVALRHIHLPPEQARLRGLADGQLLRLRALTRRPVIFEQVLLRVHPDFAPAVHLDYDEANACGFAPGDLGVLEWTRP